MVYIYLKDSPPFIFWEHPLPNILRNFTNIIVIFVRTSPTCLYRFWNGICPRKTPDNPDPFLAASHRDLGMLETLTWILPGKVNVVLKVSGSQKIWIKAVLLPLISISWNTQSCTVKTRLQTKADVTVEMVLKDHPIGNKNVVFQDRWSFGDKFEYVEIKDLLIQKSGLLTKVVFHGSGRSRQVPLYNMYKTDESGSNTAAPLSHNPLFPLF